MCENDLIGAAHVRKRRGSAGHPLPHGHGSVCHQRRGSIYVMTLGATTAVVVIGLAAVTALRVERRTVKQLLAFTEARLYAQSAIELGIHWIENDSTWRTSRGEGFWTVNQPIGQGSFTLEANDLGSNGLLESSADTDSVLLTGIGMQGDARYKLQVTLTAEVPPLTCLEVALHAGVGIQNENSTTVQSNQIISANDWFENLGSNVNVYADVEAVNSIIGAGGIFHGSTTTGIIPRSMPDSTVFDYYIANGTAIPYSSIPGGQMEKVVLSPTNNPYGAGLNSEGIYVVNCASNDLTIKDCRIEGTLVLLNLNNFWIQSAVHIAPAVVNYPSLMIQGSPAILIELNPSPLSEAAISTNLNPPSAPYQGVWDTDFVDSYPTRIEGLVYVSQDATLDTSTFEGVVVVGNKITTRDSTTFNYRDTFLRNPPPGFQAGPARMVISPGSWKQVVD